jgi:MSHA biogenesis protein MshL
MNSNPIDKMRLYSRFAIPTALTLILSSCTPYYTTEQPQASGVLPEKTQTVQKQLPALPAMPAASEQTQGKYHQAQPKFFNVSVHDIDAREFFMGLVMDSNENIVVHPEVSGTISLKLKNVSLDQVIDIVERVYGYDCEKSDAGYIVYPAKMQTKIFKIDRLDLLREGRSNTVVTSGQNTAQNNQRGNNNQQSNSSNSSGNSSQQNNNQQGSNNSQNSQSNNSWIRTSSSTDFWKELEDALQAILAIDVNAKVTMNRQSGVIVVRAKPMQLREIENFLNTTQNQISRQVVLEAKIMEVVLDSGHQDGVNWKMLAQNGLREAAGLVTGFGVPNPAKFSSMFALSADAGSFSAMLELLETQGKTNVLSSPRISTLNNQKAIIKVGRDEYFITEISANTTSSVTTNNSTPLPTAVMSSFFSGIVLDVTPQIDDADNITLHIHPSITKVENLEKTFKVFNEDYAIPTALNTIRESDSIVKAQNGQVIVLGGLMQESEVENKEGVTGLATIPFIGHLFRVDKGTTQKSELIILLKASIVDSGSDWENAMSPSKRRFEQLKARPLWK